MISEGQDPTMAEPRTVVEMFERRLSASGPEPFLINPWGPPLTFAEVDRLAGSVAERLKAMSGPPGSVVGLYLANQPHWVIASLAAWSMGAAVAAVNRLMPVPAATELLSISQATAVCVEDGDEAQLMVPSVAVSVDTAGLAPSASDARWMAAADPGAAAAILFTSGTTGQPKGFVSTHQRMVEDGRNQAASYSKVPSFRESMAPAGVAPVVSFTAYGHAAAYSSLAFALWSGRQLALIPKFTVEAVRDLLVEYQLSALRLNPAALHMLATTPLELDLSGVRYVYSGTAPLPQKTRELFSTRFGVPILQGYGQSETGPISLSRYEDVVSGREPAGSVGAVLDRVECASPTPMIDLFLPARKVRSRSGPSRRRCRWPNPACPSAPTGSCGPATSDTWTPTATSRSRAGSSTSWSWEASTSSRPRSRTPFDSASTSPTWWWSACPTSGWVNGRSPAWSGPGNRDPTRQRRWPGTSWPPTRSRGSG